VLILTKGGIAQSHLAAAASPDVIKQQNPFDCDSQLRQRVAPENMVSVIERDIETFCQADGHRDVLAYCTHSITKEGTDVAHPSARLHIDAAGGRY